MTEQPKQFAFTIAGVTVLSLSCVVATVVVVQSVPKEQVLAVIAAMGLFSAGITGSMYALFKKVESGQQAATGRSTEIKSTLNLVADKIAESEGMPRNIIELRQVIREETKDVAEKAALRAIQLYHEQVTRSPVRDLGT